MIYGTRNNKAIYKDLTVKNDLSIEGDMSFGDASTDTLTVTGAATFAAAVTISNMLELTDSQTGGASNGSVIKKQLITAEDYTGTTAGVMAKMYGVSGATVSSGEFTGLYVSVKGLHVSPGNNASIISAHVHGSNTTVIHAGLWLYGDMTNGVKMSGSTLTSAIDISEATAVTNLFDLPAAGTAPVATGEGTVGNQKVSVAVTYGGTTGYLVVYDGVAAS